MTTARAIVFLSHINEEAQLAAHLKHEVEEAFIGTIEVFVSSDPESISPGRRWMDSISKGLKDCAASFLLCSPASVQRPWIWFEAGAGWIRDIDVVPLCHSGMTPDRLPVPLSFLQAIDLNNRKGLETVVTLLTKVAGVRRPPTDLDTLLTWVREWQQNYLFWDNPGASLKRLMEGNGDATRELVTMRQATVFHFNEYRLREVQAAAEFLHTN